MDLGGFILLFGSLLSILYGYEAFRQSDYLKFLTSISGYRSVISYLRVSRMLLLTLFYTVIISAAIIYAQFIKKIDFAKEDIIQMVSFYAVTLLVQFFFFLIGTITASVRPRWAGLLIIAFWMFFVYVAPMYINQWVENRASDISSNYSSELKKLEFLLKFQKAEANKTKKDWESQLQKYITFASHLKREKLVTLKDYAERLKNLKNEKEKRFGSIPIEDLEVFQRFEQWLNLNKNAGEGKIDLNEWISCVIKSIGSEDFLNSTFPEIQQIDTDLEKKLVKTLLFFIQFLYYFHQPTTLRQAMSLAAEASQIQLIFLSIQNASKKIS